MAHARLSSLLVIALLQLSQTEISSTLPESWYAANVINDGSYSPKPISEIFTTQPTFSSTNPIVVLSSSPPPAPPPVPPPGPPTAPSAPPSTSVPTATVSSAVSSTEKPATEVSVVPLPTETPAAPAPERPQSDPTVVTERQTSPPPRFPELSLFQQPPSPPSPPPIVSTPQRIRVQTASQGTPPPSRSVQNQPPNYFLLYQQAPQTIQNYPSGPPIISLPPLESTSSPRPPTTSSTLRPTVASSLPSKVTSATLPPSAPSSLAPCTTGAPQASTQLPSFRIRLVAPSGSVTNVRINPEPSTSSTRRPATTRTRKRNKNTFDGCVGGCGGHKIPICASPLGVSPVDPDALKGFPSVCHMACHNSYRKNLYEKVMDGKCGRLRTRIRPAGGGKLTRDNLNKAHYTIVQDGAAVLEFQPLGS